MTALFDDATRAQIDAARPDASTWLGANAGSGKTRVLTDRVARLLLDEVEPQHILCLTYTKAAASEMQNRLFRRLGGWAMLDDIALMESLAELGVDGALTPDRMRMARTLFARAIETPGGLKIQTIHSFCASLLRRFPLEAGVSPQFTEIEDRAADLLRAEIVDHMAEGQHATLVAELARYHTGEDLGKLTKSLVAQREGFAEPLGWEGVLTLFGQPADLNESGIAEKVFLGSEASIFDEMIPHLREKGGNDAKAAEKLATVTVLDFATLPLLENFLLTGANAKSAYSAKIGTFPTKQTQAQISHLMPALNKLMQRVENARDTRLALEAARKTHALHAFAGGFLPIYEAEKQKRGWLDFDDLILRARALLNDPKVAAWVLYRIDGGVDHILVDEAQDTSPRQWDVIERLSDEFFSGDGARKVGGRTVFVVGDKKQSIYSFQGADPREFDRKQDLFEERIKRVGQIFQRRSLEYSFRSSSAILRLVDTAFGPHLQPDFAKGLQHRAFKSELPGRVDLWPVVETTDDVDDRVWSDPVDRRGAHHHTVVLAEQIAQRIRSLIEGEHYIPDDSDPAKGVIRRRMRAGDFLILVQRRSPLFSEIIRACKAAKLPIAGADRLKVGAELAVRDLAALLSFLATPEDSLALAIALKSPLFGWTEQMLFGLAHHRTEDHLWQALRNHEDHIETVTMLRDLRGQVDFLRPYDLIERILTRHDGRRKLLSRLGPEAEDGIDAMLTQALGYERGTIPSLTGFLAWMQTDDLEIKRRIDSASDQIRVMTVHGAKGLESPIVVLPDTGRRDIQIKDEIITINDVPVWKTTVDAMPEALRIALDARKKREAEERLRLLYVAITRAEKWLIVAAAGDLPKDGNSWYQMVGSAMAHINAFPIGDDGVVRFQEGAWDDLPIAGDTVDVTKNVVLEPVFSQNAEPADARPETLSPSDLGGLKALSGDDGLPEEDAKSYGALVHRMLEALPTLRGPPVFDHLGSDSAEDIHAAALAEAKSVYTNPQNAHIFERGTLAEVAVTATIGKQRIHGNIDRLIIGSHSVLAVDYKTNRVVPDTAAECPEGILRQMGAYDAALRQVFPNLSVQTAVLWTRSGELMDLPHDLVTEALLRAPGLDVAEGPS